MRLEELFERGRILLPLETDRLEDAIEAILPQEEGRAAEEDGFLARLRHGDGGTLRRLTPATLIVRFPSGAAGWAGLGVAPRPLGSDLDATLDPGPRIVLAIRAPGSGEGSGGSLEQVARVLRDPSIEARLLQAKGPEEVRGIRRLMDAELIETLRVEHVLQPLSYRVFPETPLAEVVDLMARRGLQAVPVVGRNMQVLGMISAVEALRYALQRRGKGRDAAAGDREPALARDVMSRSVLCVSEDQVLADVAQMMINRDAGQLPVVREGEIVGILARDAVLAAIFGDR